MLGRRRRGRIGFLEPIDLFHDHKNHPRDDDEIQNGLEEDAIVDRRGAGRLRGGQRGLRLTGKIDEQA